MVVVSFVPFFLAFFPLTLSLSRTLERALVRLSEVHAQRADMMAYIASNEFKRQAPASGNFTAPNATFTLTPSAIGSAAVVTLRWRGVLNVTGAIDEQVVDFAAFRGRARARRRKRLLCACDARLTDAILLSCAARRAQLTIT